MEYPKMSPNVGNFVHDLVEMAKAMEALPLVQAERDRANDMVEAYAKQVQSLELRLIDRKNEIDSLNSTIHAVEAERDDAELRFLESVDRTASALAFIKSTFGSAGSLIQALEPPAPVAQVVPIASEPAVTDTALPIHHGDLEADAKDYHASMQADAPQGQSEPLSTSPEQSSGSVPVGSGTGIQSEAVSVPSDPTATETTDSSHAATTPHAEHGTSADTTTQPDDVGYHNEPSINGEEDWKEWQSWRDRMNVRYGSWQWPPRTF